MSRESMWGRMVSPARGGVHPCEDANGRITLGSILMTSLIGPFAQGAGLLFAIVGVGMVIEAVGSRARVARSRTLLRGGLGVGCVVAALICYFGLAPAFGRGKLIAATLDARSLFLLVDVNGRSHNKAVRIYDLKTGARVHQKVLSSFGVDYTVMVGAHEGRVWLDAADEGLHARDLDTGEIVVTEAALIAAAPDIAHRERFGARMIADGGLCVRHRDGYTIRIDPITLHGTRLTSARDCVVRRASSPEDGLALEGDPRRHIERSHRALDPGVSYLAAQWRDDSAKNPLKFANPQGRLLGWLADGDHRLMLARIDAESGKPRWSVPLPAGESSVAFTETNGQQLVAVTEGTITAIEANSGAVVWSIRY